MTQTIRHAPMLLAALDIETAPEPAAMDLLSGRGHPNTRNIAVHAITAAAWLSLGEQEDGTWQVKRCRSWGAPDDEFEILLALDRELFDLASLSGQLVTYNGLRHDLPVIRRRAARHWLFEMSGLFPKQAIDHRDVMRVAGLGIGDWPKLREACAGIGLSCDPDDDPIGHGQTLSSRRRKAEVDVYGTMILRLFELATERRDIRTLTEGWSAIADWILRQRPLSPHLIQFSSSPDLEAARNPLT